MSDSDSQRGQKRAHTNKLQQYFHSYRLHHVFENRADVCSNCGPTTRLVGTEGGVRQLNDDDSRLVYVGSESEFPSS